MSSPVEGGPTEFGVAPNQYTVGALEPLLARPELAGHTVDERSVVHVLPGFVYMARVALQHRDLGTYVDWGQRAKDFVDALQIRGTQVYEVTQHYAHVSRLYFFGVMHGNVDAANQLHDFLDAVQAREPFNAVLRLCAEHEVTPTAWIARHAPDPNDRARAWGTFLQTKRMRAEEQGRDLTPEELTEPGAEQFVQDVIDDRLPARTVINWGFSAFRLVTDPRQKLQVIDSVLRAANEVASSGEGVTEYIAAIMAFAREISTDPTLAHQYKEELFHQVANMVPPWTEGRFVSRRAEFELAVQIEAGSDVDQVLEYIETVVPQMEHPYNRSDLRDRLLCSAAGLYASSRSFERAAAVMARINKTSDWERALDRYVRSGGDINLARHAEMMRQIFDDAPLPEVPNYPHPEWEIRAQITDLTQQMLPDSSDFSAARDTILSMAAAVGRSESGALHMGTLDKYLHRLLNRDPESVIVAQGVVEHLAHNRAIGLQQFHELFASYGSAELAAVAWERLPTDPFVRTAADYFAYYARLVLASAGLQRRETF